MEQELKELKAIIKAIFGIPEAKINVSDSENATALTQTLKDKIEQQFNEGLKDGAKKANAKLLTSINTSLGISIKESDLENSETLLSKVKDKFETAPASNPNVKDSAEYKELSRKFDSMLTEKDNEISKIKNDLFLETENIRKDSILKDVLFNAKESFLLPEKGSEELEERLEMAKAWIDRKQFTHKKEDDGKYYRVDKDGLIVRDGSKKVSYEDDVRKALTFAFGKGEQGQGGGMGIPREPAGGEGQKGFDWSKAIAKNPKFQPPKNQDEVNKLLFDPTTSVEEQAVIVEFVESGALTPAPTI